MTLDQYYELVELISEYVKQSGNEGVEITKLQTISQNWFEDLSNAEYNSIIQGLQSCNVIVLNQDNRFVVGHDHNDDHDDDHDHNDDRFNTATQL